MEDQNNVYSEKKLASFETIYKESVFSKPLDITVTLTAAHIYGSGYVCVQKGTKEDDPEYGKYVCGLEDITKVSINTNNKSFPINVQCDEVEKGVPSRKRIILPHFPNYEEIVRLITDAKADYDRKHAPAPAASEEEKKKERERLKKQAEDEFLAATEGYSKSEKEKPKKYENPPIEEILGLDDFTPIEKTDISKAVKAEVKEELDAIPEPVVVKEKQNAEAKSAPRSAPVPAESEAFAEPEHYGSDLEAAPEAEDIELEVVSGMSGSAAADSFDEIVIPDTSDLPEAHAVESPGYIPAEIETIGVVDLDENSISEPKIVTHSSRPKPAPEPAADPKPAAAKPAAVSPEKSKLDIPMPKEGEKMSLEDFQTAVKKLKAMHDEGLLSDEEFNAEKSVLMKFLY